MLASRKPSIKNCGWSAQKQTKNRSSAQTHKVYLPTVVNNILNCVRSKSDNNLQNGGLFTASLLLFLITKLDQLMTCFGLTIVSV
jgi:hypothetical protein